jgi:hypothetical protein
MWDPYIIHPKKNIVVSTCHAPSLPLLYLPPLRPFSSPWPERQRGRQWGMATSAAGSGGGGGGGKRWWGAAVAVGSGSSSSKHEARPRKKKEARSTKRRAPGLRGRAHAEPPYLFLGGNLLAGPIPMGGHSV